MPFGPVVVAHLPGLLQVAVLTAVAFMLARLPGLGLLGPLLLSLLLGLAWRALGRDQRITASGSDWSAKWLLRLGIVLLGVRLDARVLLELGPVVLVGSVLGALVAFMAVEGLGRAARLPVELRRAVAIGTAICGASAVAAAMPLLRAKQEQASAAIAAISVVGTMAALGLVAWDRLDLTPPATMAMLAGATLQEVGQVVAAGSAIGAEGDAAGASDGGGAGELALLVKLSRVLLLAPALLLLGRFGGTGAATAGEARATLLPPYLVAFLALATLGSLGLLPPALMTGLSLGGTVLTTAAMAGIGLAVDLRSLGRLGAQAAGLAAVGFLALLAAMATYYGWWLGVAAG